ncbi:MAG: hypothetical protein HYR70_04750 [Chloroflexi bacterium]|nr:hypothetical protein [Chloroflexota bacterium]MBI1855341.1 hypothetical protein [Chloroflexota bacterium]MBI3340485.1 hypothetical protein [Chloroflexota bacterium]
MQNDSKATDPVDTNDIRVKAPKTNRNWAWGCIAVVVACVALFYALAFFSGYMPVSTLPVKELPNFNLFLEACKGSVQIWPPSGENPNPKFPAYSPDGKWYIVISATTYRDAEELMLYQMESNRLVGIYSFEKMDIQCWAKDSSGIYYTGGASGGFFDPFNLSQIDATPKKILIPCQNDLQEVSFWMKTYWGMRCAMPDSYGPIAALLPIILLLIGAALAVAAIIWIWQRWTQK